MTEHGLHNADAQLLAAQIQSDIQELELSNKVKEERLRPILTHLNADTSWLLSLPVPRGEELLGQGGRSNKYLHLCFDPWFTGTQEDVHGWFSRQWHKEESKYQSLEEVEDLIAEIEGLPKSTDKLSESFDDSRGSDNVDADGVSVDGTVKDDERESKTSALSDGCMSSLIDAIIISHEFTDHMHEATLRSAVPSIPIFAPKGKAIDLLHTWSHFDTAVPIELTPSPEEEPDWRNWCPGEADVEGLEWTRWLKITRLQAPEKSMIGYHEGMLFTYPRPAILPGSFTNFPLPNPGSQSLSSDLESGSGEAIIYTPHGLPPSAVGPLVQNKNIHTLALLHGEHDIRLAGAQLNLGERNGKEVVKATGAKYWLATHDEVKHGSGLVSWFLSRTLGKGKEIVEGDKAQEMEKELDGKVQCRTVENGGRLVLM